MDIGFDARTPAAVSEREGSEPLRRPIRAWPPVSTGPVFTTVAVGATLLTTTVVVESVKRLSLSKTRP